MIDHVIHGFASVGGLALIYAIWAIVSRIRSNALANAQAAEVESALLQSVLSEVRALREHEHSEYHSPPHLPLPALIAPTESSLSQPTESTQPQ